MKTRAISALVAVAGTAAVAAAQSATYSIAFGTAGGSNNVVLTPGQSVPVFVNVGYSVPNGIQLSNGTFSINGAGTAGSMWAVNNTPSSPGYSLPAPWGAQSVGGLGVAVGTPSANGVSGAEWGYGFLLTTTATHPGTQNVWQGTFTAGAAGVINLSFSGLGQTGVYTGPGPVPGVANVATTGGTGQITIIPAPASLALLGLGGLVAARRRR